MRAWVAVVVGLLTAALAIVIITSLPADARTRPSPPSALPFNVVAGSNGQQYVTEAFGVGFNMGGGELHRWGTPEYSKHHLYWNRFEQVGPSDGTVVWWYVMTRGATADPLVDPTDAMAEVDTVIAELVERRPDATIYVSGMADYAVGPFGMCNPTPDRAQWAAQYALDTYPDVVVAGPVIPAVVDLAHDGCHPGAQSKAAAAAVLVDWWDAVGG